MQCKENETRRSNTGYLFILCRSHFRLLANLNRYLLGVNRFAECGVCVKVPFETAVSNSSVTFNMMFCNSITGSKVAPYSLTLIHVRYKDTFLSKSFWPALDFIYDLIQGITAFYTNHISASSVYVKNVRLFTYMLAICTYISWRFSESENVIVKNLFSQQRVV